MGDLTLYDFELDEGCYAARLMLVVLGLGYAKVAVNMIPAGERAAPEGVPIDPHAALPILVDGDRAMSGTVSVLRHLAGTYGGGVWLPAPADAVDTWLAFADRELAPARLARLSAMFEVPADRDAALAGARRAFRTMEDHMTARGFDGLGWFAADRATVADLALFPGFALSRDAGIEHDQYPALRHWMRRVRALPGFHTMPGIPDYS